MIRTFAHEIVEEMAEYASVPVINGLTDYSHPCQAMADFLTILEVKGRIEGLKLAFVGDGNNVAHSLMFAGAQLGAHVWIATRRATSRRPTRSRGPTTQRRDRRQLHRHQRSVERRRGADVIYTDVWASMGQEAEAAARKKIFLPYQVNEAMFAHAKPDAIFMHCLPAHRGDEVTDDVIDSPRSVVVPGGREPAARAEGDPAGTSGDSAEPSIAQSGSRCTRDQLP